jgi:hypothetical protein
MQRPRLNGSTARLKRASQFFRFSTPDFPLAFFYAEALEAACPHAARHLASLLLGFSSEALPVASATLPSRLASFRLALESVLLPES